MINQHDILSPFGGLQNNSFNHIIDIDNTEDESMNDEFILMKQSHYYDDKCFIDKFNGKSNTFNILSLNCQCINAKIDQIKIKIEYFREVNCEFSIICLQETWLSEESDTSSFKINGYTLISQGKICSGHGGLAIYLKDDYIHKNLQLYKKSTIWEGQFIEISSPTTKKKLIIGNIYRPPYNVNANYATFIEEFEPIITYLQTLKSEVIIAGDYNIDLLKIKEHSLIQEYFDTITSHSFFPNITLPTRFSERRATLIDNFLCKLSPKTCKATAGIFINQISDHLPYFICLDHFTFYKPIPKYITMRKLNTLSLNNFKVEIANSNILNKLDKNIDTDPNFNYDILSKCLHSSMEKHLPTVTKKYNKHKHKKSPWITYGLIHAINKRDKLYMKLKQIDIHSQHYGSAKINLHTYNKILRKTMHLAKKIYYDSCFKKFQGNAKKTWSTISEVLNHTSNKKEFPEYFKINNQLISDKKTIADKFNSFFVNIGPELASQIPGQAGKSFKDYLNDPNKQNFSFDLINEDTISSITKNMKPKSSCGIDGLSTKLLKFITIEIIKPLTLIINQCLTTGIFPDKLKIAKIVPIHKKEEKDILNNYRPISLLPSVSKVIERVMFNQIYAFFQTNKLFYYSQYGFREKHSTDLAALEMVDRLAMEIDKGETPLNIYLDLSKAFDTLDHDILIYKLSYYGIKGTALNLCKSYLTDRKQLVELDNSKSDLKNITTGVPQGSILGPLLFIIYVNDIQKASKIFKAIMYADDTSLTSILKVFNHSENLNKNINNELLRISVWLKLNKLSLNVQKTKFMIFHNRQKQHIIKPEIQIEGTKIECVDNFNFLGINIDKHLNWNSHVYKIAGKIIKTTGIINRLKNTLPCNILCTIYTSLIGSQINYGILLWGNNSDRIYKLQKRVVRILSRNKYNAHTEPIFKELKILKISDTLKLQVLKFYYKLVNNMIPEYFNNLMPKTFSDIHQRPTRQNNKFITPLVNHECTRKSLRHYMINILNNTVDNIITKIYTHSYFGFSFYAKTYLLGLYETICNINNCYICQN